MSTIKHTASSAVFSVITMLPAVATAQGAAPAGAYPSIPSSIQSEHKELHARLAKTISAGGRTGAAAKEVERLLAPHFRKEEQYAMPPLGLLPDHIDSAVMVWVPLNDAGMEALQATDGFFTIGLSAPGENYVFGNSEGSGPQLLLRGEVKMIPEPPVAGMLTAGLVLLAVVGSWRRREPGLFEPDGPEGGHL
ncbi:MAG TPA: hypothetical protein VFT37_01485 [Telluria sp.]|nr:hypothetical protein [Telluria sp.]